MSAMLDGRTHSGIPERRDGGVVLVHGDSEPVEFVVGFHITERVKVDVAVEVNIRSTTYKQDETRYHDGKRWFKTHSTRQYHLYFCRSSCL